MSSGACAVGFASAAGVDIADTEAYRRWLAEGLHGEMLYLEKYPDIRTSPGELLYGARTVISAAFSYNHPSATQGALRWARYALGDDYHEVVRRRLSEVAARLPGESRVCVDTAPLRERYWAVKAGIGFRGLNGMVIIPGAGSYVVLGEILTTLDIEPDEPLGYGCDGCRRCIEACPGHALDGTGGMDARRCRSYLTIEYRGGELPALTGGRIYGCDICQEVCPHNQNITAQGLPEFTPRESILALTAADILSMPQPAFSAIFTRSAIKRTKLTGLRRNVSAATGTPSAPGRE